MLPSRFIGGSTIQEVVKRMQNQAFVPIFDYAKESSVSYIDTLKYISRLKQDMQHVPVDSTFALKYSSFNDARLMNYLVTLLIDHKHKVLLDAEDDKYHDEEKLVYDELIKKHNENTVNVFKTYQMYRKDSYHELIGDFHKFKFLGIKQVRGAYLKRDMATGSLFSTKEDTDNNYNNALRYAMAKMKQKNNAHLMLATHNVNSMNFALTLDPDKNKVCFAQLLGMCDDYGEKLLKSGFTVYKYVPYGSFLETYPYLLRRLYENYDVLKYAL